MEQYLVDTNMVSGYLSASFPSKSLALIDQVFDAVPNISILTQIELLCWNTDVETPEDVKEFIKDSIVLDISPDVVYHCVNLRKGKKIKHRMQ